MCKFKYKDCEGKVIKIGSIVTYLGCIFCTKKRWNSLYLELMPSDGFHDREFIKEYGRTVDLCDIDCNDLYVLEEE